MKRFIAAVLALLLLFVFSGCDAQQQPMVRFLEEFFSCIDQADYAAAYALTTQSTRDRMDLPEFVSKYQNIYANIETSAVKATFGATSALEEGYAITADIVLTCSFGEINWQEACNVRRENGEWRLDWHPSLLLTGMDWGDSARVVTEQARRGEILSKDATQWAINSYAPTVYVRLPLDGEETEGKFASRVAPILQMEASEVLEILQSERSQADGIALLRSYPIDAMSDALDARIKAAGMGVDYEKYSPIRYYPQGNVLSHILGYTQPIGEDEFKDKQPQGYSAYSHLGRAGLESAYEDVLRGSDGRFLRIYNSAGTFKRTVAGYAAQNGQDIELTVNYPLQVHATRMLEELPDTYAGAAIVLDPQSGELLAAAGYPDIDPNDFIIGMTDGLAAAYNDSSSGNPQYNRITQGRYPPGSTIKPFTAAAGISTGKFSTSYEFSGDIEDNAWIPEGEWPYPAIRRVRGGYGDMDMMNAMTYSDNIYFANIALEIGWEVLEPYFANAGFNESVPFDLPTQPSRLYVRESLDNRKLLADTGYGQGEMLSTPLQLAASFCAFANNGSCYRPRVVSAVKRMEGDDYIAVTEYAPEVWKESVITGDVLKSMRNMLAKVMTRGTGKNVKVDEDIVLFGKTGTAQLDDNQAREIAWIVVFGEDDSGYSRLVCVMLEVPAGEGSERYAIAQELLKPEMSEYGSLQSQTPIYTDVEFGEDDIDEN